MINLKKADIYIIALTTLFAIGFYLTTLLMAQAPAALVVITVNGKEYQTIPLNQNKTVRIAQNGHVNVMEVKDGKVRMLSADCPDKLCVKQGDIVATRQAIVCLPNRVVLTIVGKNSKMDAISN